MGLIKDLMEKVKHLAQVRLTTIGTTEVIGETNFLAKASKQKINSRNNKRL